MHINCDYLRHEKKKAMESEYQRGIDLREKLKVEKYMNATVLPGKKVDELPNLIFGGGGVMDEEGFFIDASKNSELFGGAYSSSEFNVSNKTVVYCGFCNLHWGHFLIDVVPRLWYVLEHDLEVEEYVIVGPEKCNQVLNGNIMRFLRLLGIADKVRIQNTATKYKCVIVPELSYRYCSGFDNDIKRKYYSKKFIETFDYVVDRALDKFYDKKDINKKLFFTRSKLNTIQNRDFGIEMLDSLFWNNGYQILYPEHLSLEEMIFMLNNCSDFACIQGTIQHNLLFVRKKINLVVVERFATVHSVQNDICIMRDIDTTFIDANICIFPTANAHFIYSYNKCLQEYIKDNEMELPDYQYMTNEFRKNNVLKYMQNYYFPEYDITWNVNKTEYFFAACNECINELQNSFCFTPYKDISDFIDERKIRYRLMKCLVDNHLNYSQWLYIDIFREFAKIIEKGITEERTEFLIYPFGRNGIIFKQILNESYGLMEKAIFDNKLCKFNNKIRSIREIKQYHNKNTCFVLTSNKVECRDELLKYCDMDIIEGPFTILK